LNKQKTLNTSRGRTDEGVKRQVTVPAAFRGSRIVFLLLSHSHREILSLSNIVESCMLVRAYSSLVHRPRLKTSNKRRWHTLHASCWTTLTSRALSPRGAQYQIFIDMNTIALMRNSFQDAEIALLAMLQLCMVLAWHNQVIDLSVMRKHVNDPAWSANDCIYKWYLGDRTSLRSLCHCTSTLCEI